jgi:hypothetical protein
MDREAYHYFKRMGASLLRRERVDHAHLIRYVGVQEIPEALISMLAAQDTID